MEENAFWATNIMFAQLKKMPGVRQQYAQISNAQLEMVQGLSHPAWVMELYDSDRVTALAVLEAPQKSGCRCFYIVYGEVKHRPIIDCQQVYKETEENLAGYVFSDCRENVCIKWR